MACITSFGDKNSGFQAGKVYGDVNVQFNSTSERSEMSLNQACLRDLATTDPHDDKDRIENLKGGLLKDSYCWILDNEEFKQWRWSQDSSLLWIKGDPGKGKTMLLCGIINELMQSTTEAANVSFFFCQETDVRINSATAVLRGLIYSLVNSQPLLLSHVRRRYDKVGKQIFEDTNAWEALSKILTHILEDSNIRSTYLIIDALDECSTGLPLLLDLIVRKSSVYPHVKWIVSSRNWPSIQERLETATQTASISLELNNTSVSESVRIYIQHKVRELAKLKRYNHEILQAVSHHLLSNSQGTFLWVALVSQELAKTSRWNTISKLNTLPSGLTALYHRMLEQTFTAEDADLCQRILAVVLTVYRPITLDELTTFVDIPCGVIHDYEALSEIIALCGSFLILRSRTIFFIHQSAKEFLMDKASTHFFVSGIKDQHLEIFSRSLKFMFGTLRRNIYNLGSPGFLLDQVRQLDPDPLAAAQYSCFFWVDHLQVCNTNANNDLESGGSVEKFLKQKFLHWVEAISLLRGISEGIAAIIKLERLFKKMGKSPAVSKRVQDAYRFIRYHRRAIESSPLQVYNSSLIFSPAKSINKICYQNERPQWVLNEPVMEDDWSPCLQTFEGHSSSVTSVGWSPDGSRLASGSHDSTVIIWDPATGQCISTLKGHSKCVTSIAWSPDGSQLASGSGDSTVKIWDQTNGQCVFTLEVNGDLVWSVAWSPDGRWLVSGSSDRMVRIWDLTTGKCTSTLGGHSNPVTSIAWSPCGSQLASGSGDKTVKIWDLATGKCTSTLEGHSDWVFSIAWSPDGSRFASGSGDKKVRIWDPATSKGISTLEGHGDWVSSIAWLADGSQLASGSWDSTVKVWDPATGKCVSTREGHSKLVESISWSPDGSQLASGSGDNTVKIWDQATGQYTSKLEAHSHTVWSIAWSPDGSRLASGSHDSTVKIWDPATGQCISTLKGHNQSVWPIAWSPDGSQLASGSGDSTVKIWEPINGLCLSTLEVPGDLVASVAWSPDGRWLASGSSDRMVRIWDLTTRKCTWNLEGHRNSVTSIAWSADGKRLVSGSGDKTVKIWDLATEKCVSTLEGHCDSVNSIAWSPDGTRLATGSRNDSVRIWDPANAQCISILHVQSPNLRFGEENLHHLYTEIGVFDLDSALPHSASFAQSAPLLRPVGYGFDHDRNWISFRGENILWLPPECRPVRSALFITSASTTVAIACSTGRVMMMTFSNDNLNP